MEHEASVLPLVIEVHGIDCAGITHILHPFQLLRSVDMSKCHQIVIRRKQHFPCNDRLKLHQELRLSAFHVASGYRVVRHQNSDPALVLAHGSESCHDISDLI